MLKTFEKTDFKNDDWGPYVDEVSVTYYQDNDCTESGEEGQSITLSSRNNGMARFVNIKTENWSIDGVEDLKKLIDDFYERAGIKHEENGKENTEQGHIE